jgi:hypothetical protein
MPSTRETHRQDQLSASKINYPAQRRIRAKTLWHQRTPARWIMPPSFGSGDRRLILAEVLFIPVRMIASSLIAVHRGVASLVGKRAAIR